MSGFGLVAAVAFFMLPAWLFLADLLPGPRWVWLLVVLVQSGLVIQFIVRTST